MGPQCPQDCFSGGYDSVFGPTILGLGDTRPCSPHFPNPWSVG